MIEYIEKMKGWEFTKSTTKGTYKIQELWLTDEYTLKVLSNMGVGHVVTLGGYALKRIK